MPKKFKDRLIYSELEQQEIVNFTNVDSEDFVGHYKGHMIMEDVEILDQFGNTTIEKRPKVVPFEFPIKAGETRQFVLPQAEHFAKHLIDKILLRDNGNHFGEEAFRKPLWDKILGDISIQEPIRDFGENNPTAPSLEPIVEPEFPDVPKEEVKEVQEVSTSVKTDEFKCEVCGKVAKSRIGLAGHMRSHK